VRYHVKPTLPESPAQLKTNLLGYLTAREWAARQQASTVPVFYPGSMVAVNYYIMQSNPKLHRFVGLCIAKSNKGIASSFVLRNVIQDMAVEQRFFTHSPRIHSIELLRLDRARRAKLYYLRNKPLKYSHVNPKLQKIA
jgi:large subunit ribosomal protein L19